jgi:hypothetical protein
MAHARICARCTRSDCRRRVDGRYSRRGSRPGDDAGRIRDQSYPRTIGNGPGPSAASTWRRVAGSSNHR